MDGTEPIWVHILKSRTGELCGTATVLIADLSGREKCYETTKGLKLWKKNRFQSIFLKVMSLKTKFLLLCNTKQYKSRTVLFSVLEVAVL